MILARDLAKNLEFHRPLLDVTKRSQQFEKLRIDGCCVDRGTAIGQRRAPTIDGTRKWSLEFGHDLGQVSGHVDEFTRVGVQVVETAALVRTLVEQLVRIPPEAEHEWRIWAAEEGFGLDRHVGVAQDEAGLVR